MIIFTAAGQLGNQIFQLYYLETIKKKGEKIFCLGMNSVLSNFTGYSNDYFNTDNKIFCKFFDIVIRRILLFLSRIRVISEIYEEDCTKKNNKSLLPITFCRGYFQAEHLFDKELINKITLHKEYVEQAKDYISKVNKTNKKNLFIHVRHGDYPTKWLIDDVYYQNAIKHFDEKKYFFFLVGDDPNWMNKQFSYLQNKAISTNSYLVDLAIMMQCEGGIISNSSFAWWGAYLRAGKETVIAPQYWLGYKNKKWEPKYVKTESYTYIV